MSRRLTVSASPELSFRVLGPVEIWRHGELVTAGPPKARMVLAVLLSEAGRTVPVHRLVDAVWGEDPPASAKKNLHGYICALRHEILCRPDLIQRCESGYRLTVRPGELDADRFEALSEAGFATRDTDEAYRLFRQALDLWHGEDAYAGMEPVPLESARLREMRLDVLLGWADAGLRLGRPAEVIPELRTFSARHRLREDLAARLMEALRASNRHAEALESYEETERTLAEQLETVPGPELTGLRNRILDERGRRPGAAAHARSGAPRHRGTTDLGSVEAAEYAAAWWLPPLRMRPLGERPFQGCLDAAEVGAVVVGHLRCTPHTLRRRPPSLGSTDPDLLKVVLNRSRTRMLVRQDGRECRVDPGDLVMCDMTRPYDIAVPGACDVSFLGIPRSRLGRDADVVSSRSAIPISADVGLTALISTCLKRVSDYADQVPGPSSRHLGDALTSLIMASLTESTAERADVRTDLADRVFAYVSANLHDPNLSAESVADRFGITLRHLHRLCRSRGSTFTEWVRRQRSATGAGPR